MASKTHILVHSFMRNALRTKTRNRSWLCYATWFSGVSTMSASAITSSIAHLHPCDSPDSPTPSLSTQMMWLKNTKIDLKTKIALKASNSSSNRLFKRLSRRSCLWLTRPKNCSSHLRGRSSNGSRSRVVSEMHLKPWLDSQTSSAFCTKSWAGCQPSHLSTTWVI